MLAAMLALWQLTMDQEGRENKQQPVGDHPCPSVLGLYTQPGEAGFLWSWLWAWCERDLGATE